ncbi:MAG: SDR family NAD(P)-dependent oxidoreductase [Candidatus Marinimicrobia bacterium]|nr:SDR family NAD(P)-dependent oxidoreductase [Candidatus Neomarinimicrobiota bacterium]
MSRIMFEDRVAVVTGAGGGLGETYALELARRGCRVVVNDLGSARDGTGGGRTMADEVVDRIREEGGEATANYDGVHTKEGGEGIIQAALNEYGKIDILIHNAGILRDRSFAKMEENEWRSVIEVHLNGAYYVTRPAFRVMKERKYGRILLTTSTSGLFGNFGQANYAAAKMGQIGLMHVLAIEGAKYGIKVNAISPGAMTRMTEDLDRTDLPEVSRDPEHITAAAIYLVSKSCSQTNSIIHASYGFFGRVQVAYNPGIFLGEEPASVEKFAEHWDDIAGVENMKVQGETPYLLTVLKKASEGDTAN